MLQRRMVVSLTLGLVPAILTWLFTVGTTPHSVGLALTFLIWAIFLLLIPGMLLGFLLGHNVHIVNVWLMVAGNFIIYGGVAYFLIAKWEERRTIRQKDNLA